MRGNRLRTIGWPAVDGWGVNLLSRPVAPVESGPQVIVGEASSANFYFSPETYPEPTVALLDASNTIKKEPVFVSDQGQILGTFDTGMFPLPAKFSINLPIQPTATSIDLDNNGKADVGVQIFSLAIGSNLTGDSYLQQLEQADAMSSLIADMATGDITEGSILVYAPDDKQGFPTGYGADKKWLTSDDPAAPLLQGYSVARLGANGSVTLDRAAQATLNTGASTVSGAHPQRHRPYRARRRHGVHEQRSLHAAQGALGLSHGPPGRARSHVLRRAAESVRRQHDGSFRRTDRKALRAEPRGAGPVRDAVGATRTRCVGSGQLQVGDRPGGREVARR